MNVLQPYWRIKECMKAMDNENYERLGCFDADKKANAKKKGNLGEGIASDFIGRPPRWPVTAQNGC